MRTLFSLFLMFFLIPTHAAQSASPPPAIPLKISLGYHIDPCQGPILYAMAMGIFKEYGLDVKTLPASGGEESSRHVAMGIADIGITKSANHVVRVSSSGLPLRKIGTLVKKTLEVLLTHKQIKELADLKGKKIGFSTSNPTFSMIVLDQILKKAGLSRSDVELIAFHHGMMQAFLSKQVDAIFTATVPYDVKMAEDFGVDVTIHTYAAFDIPDFEQFMFFTHKNNSAKPFIAPFLKAIKESIMMIKQNPSKAWAELCNAYPDLDTTLNYRIWMGLSEDFDDHPEHLYPEDMEKLIAFLKDKNVEGEPVLATPVSVNDVMIKGT